MPTVPRSTRQATGIDLPALEPGLTLLDVTDDLGVTPVQSLIVDRALGGSGDVYWADGDESARTTTLRELAPDPRLLDRIRVARGFTAQQHASLIDRLGGLLETADRDGDGPSLVVTTGLDRRFLGGDVNADVAEELFVKAIATLAGLARSHGVPVLATRTRENAFTRPLENAAGTRIRCESTRFGPRFVDESDDHETLLYDVGSGYVQTTIAFWRDVLAHRARRDDSVVAPTEPAATASTLD